VKRAGGMDQVVECLPSKCKALNTNTNTAGGGGERKKLSCHNWSYLGGSHVIVTVLKCGREAEEQVRMMPSEKN
jgi:hypothetical protein